MLLYKALSKDDSSTFKLDSTKSHILAFYSNQLYILQTTDTSLRAQ